MSVSAASMPSRSSRKRSISASIMGLFKKQASAEGGRDNNNNNNNTGNADSCTRSIQKKRKLNSVNSTNTADLPLIILYENEKDNHNKIHTNANTTQNYMARPPILPILPIQRLRILREKQKLRSLRDTNFIHSLSDSKKNSRSPDHSVISTKPSKHGQENNTSNINNYKLKTTTAAALNTANSITSITKKGTVWSGDFEYDLAECDTQPTQNISHNVNRHKYDPMQMSPPSSMNNSISNQDEKKLSNFQKNLVINGPNNSNKNNFIPSSNVKISTENVIAHERTKSNVVLPSIGFDFIKNSETPSKSTTPPFHKKSSTSSSSPTTTTTPLKPNSTSTTVQGSASVSNKTSAAASNLTARTKTPSNLSFSFTAKPSSNLADGKSNQNTINREQNDEDEQRRKKRPTPVLTVDMTNEASKPTFSFTQKENKITPFTFANNKKEDKEEDKNPSFTFGSSNTTTSISDDKKSENKPSFTFGTGATAKSSSSSTEEKKKVENKPSFTFGTGPTTTTTTTDKKTENKPSFTFGITPTSPSTTKPEVEVTNSSSKPVFSFGTSPAGATAGSPTSIINTVSKPAFSFTTTATSDSTTTKPNETKEKTPTFSFGTNSKPNETKEKTPTFSFGTNSKPNETKEKTPTFSFGTNSKPIGTPSESTEKQNNENTKPAFSFTKPATSTASTDKPANPPSFSFGLKKEATADATTPTTTNANPLFNKPTDNKTSAFSFGNNNTTNNNITSNPASTTSLPQFSFNKSNENSTTKLNNEASKLGVSLGNPLLNNTNGNTVPSTSTTSITPGLFSGVSTAPSTGTGATGFKFSRNGPTSQQASTAGSLFGSASANTAGSNLPNATSSFSFGISNNSNNMNGNQNSNNPLLSSNNTMGMNQSGGSVFGMNIGGNTSIANNNANGSNNMFNAGGNMPGQNPMPGMNFGQPQQATQNLFQPSKQVNLNFGGAPANGTMDPTAIFSAPSQPSAPLTQQPQPFNGRKFARMRQSRR